MRAHTHTHTLLHTHIPLCAITSQLFTSLLALAVWWAAGKQQCSHHTRRTRCPCQWDGTWCVTPVWFLSLYITLTLHQTSLTQALHHTIAPSNLIMSTRVLHPLLLYVLLLADQGWNAQRIATQSLCQTQMLVKIGNKRALCLMSSQWWPSWRLLMQ